MSISYRQRMTDPRARRLTALDRGPAPPSANPGVVQVAQLPDAYPQPATAGPPPPPRRRPQEWLILPALLSGWLSAAALAALWSPASQPLSAAQALRFPRSLPRVEEQPRSLAVVVDREAGPLEPAPLVVEPDEIVAIVEAPKPKAPRGSYGTAVTFRDNPADAARLAQREDKLWFVVTISGNFEESCFT
jgi:hypothetical protein